MTQLSERTRRCTSSLRESFRSPDSLPRTDPLADFPLTSDTTGTPRDAALFVAEGVPVMLLILTESSACDTLAAKPNDRASLPSVVLVMEKTASCMFPTLLWIHFVFGLYCRHGVKWTLSSLLFGG